MKLVELEQTCGACPSQWEGVTDDGRCFYARYRFGRLTWGFGDSPDAAIDASIAARGEECGGHLDGTMSTASMLRRVFDDHPTNGGRV